MSITHTPDPSKGTSGVAQEAMFYASLGWRVIPVDPNGKAPFLNQWEKAATDDEEVIAGWFEQWPQANVGIVFGPDSGIIDVECDDEASEKEFQELFDQGYDATPFYRSKRGVHRFFKHSTKLPNQSLGVFKHNGIEFRTGSGGKGAQSVAPPSTVDGVTREWILHPSECEVAEIPDYVIAKLANEVAGVGGSEKNQFETKSDEEWQEIYNGTSEGDRNTRATQFIGKMLRLTTPLDRVYTWEQTRIWNDRNKPPLEEKELRNTWGSIFKAEVERREKEAVGGTEFSVPQGTPEKNLLGTRTPETNQPILSAKKTLPTAIAYQSEFHTHPEGRTIHCYGGQFWEWQGNRFVPIEDETLKGKLQEWLHNAKQTKVTKNGIELIDFDSNPTTVKAALDTLRSAVNLPTERNPMPSWLDGDRNQRPPVQELLICKSSSIHLPTMQPVNPTPALFTSTALDFDFEPDRSVPPLWLSFLEDLFGVDQQSIETLQEWFGYCLTSDTSHQKMLLIWGAMRSGKGTIARVLTEIVGKANVCGPTSSSLTTQFGLQPLIGKSVAVVSDARFHGQHVQILAERLLCITGEDSISVDRKYLGSITLRMPTRFMFLSNELPRFRDASGALPSRFIILKTQKSFLGKEDPSLTEKLSKDLPGILNWAIEGWNRLKSRGHFVSPDSSADSVREMHELSSPVGAFVQSRCVTGAGCRIKTADLFDEYQRWSRSSGESEHLSKSEFGRDLMAAVPGIAKREGSGRELFYQGVELKTAAVREESTR